MYRPRPTFFRSNPWLPVVVIGLPLRPPPKPARSSRAKEKNKMRTEEIFTKDKGKSGPGVPSGYSPSTASPPYSGGAALATCPALVFLKTFRIALSSPRMPPANGALGYSTRRPPRPPSTASFSGGPRPCTRRLGGVATLVCHSCATCTHLTRYCLSCRGGRTRLPHVLKEPIAASGQGLPRTSQLFSHSLVPEGAVSAFAINVVFDSLGYIVRFCFRDTPGDES